MSSENICHFIPYHKDYNSIHTIHYVLETKKQVYTSLKTEALYKMYYVCKGTGLLHTTGEINQLTEGDVFFSFSAIPYAIESADDFEYIYISFLGARAYMIMDKLKINNRNCIFHDLNIAEDFWIKGLYMSEDFSDLISESVLLYTFTCLGKMLLHPVNCQIQNSNTCLKIKKYIDDNFTDLNFSIESISKELLYNKKYISAVFKKNIGIGINDYLNTIRIQQACTMIKQGFTSVSDISYQCGFSDPQYFSKVFKKRTGLSPANYKKSNNNISTEVIWNGK